MRGAGGPLTEPVRAAILALPEGSWRPALTQDDEPREGAGVAEITDRLDLAGWPEGSRAIVRRCLPVAFHASPSVPYGHGQPRARP